MTQDAAKPRIYVCQVCLSQYQALKHAPKLRFSNERRRLRACLDACPPSPSLWVSSPLPLRPRFYTCKTSLSTDSQCVMHCLTSGDMG
eukprot:scaffold293174_cov19-Tisochrysis_lutea.AAC.1